MKQKDIALIMVIVFISVVVSVFVSNAIFSSSSSSKQKATVVQPITANFSKPDSNFFNSSAFDPTQTITIGQNNNSNPFNGTTNSR